MRDKKPGMFRDYSLLSASATGILPPTACWLVVEQIADMFEVALQDGSADRYQALDKPLTI
ncbi:MAG: hypothetical protein WBO93_18330 [Gammaproteobacteria bacterium]